MMFKAFPALVCALLAGISLSASAVESAAVTFNGDYGALYYFKATKEPFDVPTAAALSPEVAQASPFDRQKKQSVAEDRIRHGLDAVNGEQALLVDVSGTISPYDPDEKALSIDLFEAGRFVPFSGYGRQFRLIFDNAEAYRTLSLPEAQARKVNDKQGPRPVSIRVSFRLTGAGDPTGLVVSSNTVRAAIVKVQLLADGRPLLPDITKTDQPQPQPTLPVAKTSGEWAIQGLHLGMSRASFEVVARAAYGAMLHLGTDRGCGDATIPVDGQVVTTGTVCITYAVDPSGIIKQFTVKQITSFGADAHDAFRKMLVERFGPVTYKERGGYGWGELVGSPATEHYTVAATVYDANTMSDMTSGTRGIPALAITITDPDFARAQLRASAQGAAPKL